MLVKKMKGESFETEYPMPEFDRVTPMKPVKDLSKIKLALVTSGGIVQLIIQTKLNLQVLLNMEFTI